MTHIRTFRIPDTVYLALNEATLELPPEVVAQLAAALTDRTENRHTIGVCNAPRLIVTHDSSGAMFADPTKLSYGPLHIYMSTAVAAAVADALTRCPTFVEVAA